MQLSPELSLLVKVGKGRERTWKELDLWHMQWAGRVPKLTNLVANGKGVGWWGGFDSQDRGYLPLFAFLSWNIAKVVLLEKRKGWNWGAQHSKCQWVIPEKIHTPPTPDGWHAGNSHGRGGRRLWKSWQEGGFGPKKSSSGVIFNRNLDLFKLGSLTMQNVFDRSEKTSSLEEN